MTQGQIAGLLTRRSARVVAAVKLHRHRERDKGRRFLAEGPRAVREALTRGAVIELLGTPSALARYPEVVDSAPAVFPIAEDALVGLAETVNPQGLIAVCRFLDVPLTAALVDLPSLVVVLVNIADPGNAGTVLRTADAAGTGTVVFAGTTVDPYNGKCVRASAGSLFHVNLVRQADPTAVVEVLQTAGWRVLAADARGEHRLDRLSGWAQPTAWLFGSESHGLPGEVAGKADARVRVPMYGRAESLNLAAAAAICVYTSAGAAAPTVTTSSNRRMT
jgi:TrmH family RNA methyltransferase